MVNAKQLTEYLQQRKVLVDAALDAHLPPGETDPKHLHEAMRYAVLGAGKRLRPIFALAVADLAGASPETVMEAACGIELAHASSLILDDLPCMDDASERRGRPCVHIKFGEASALLAAMALLSSAFELVARNGQAHGRAHLCVGHLAQAVGTQGLVHGQHLDLHYTSGKPTLEILEQIHYLKAGALFLAALAIPAHLLGMAETDRAVLETFARKVGLAFQISDDLLDEAAPLEDDGKSTFTGFLGRDGALARMHTLVDEAIDSVKLLGASADPLRVLAEFVRNRV